MIVSSSLLEYRAQQIVQQFNRCILYQNKNRSIELMQDKVYWLSQMSYYM